MHATSVGASEFDIDFFLLGLHYAEYLMFTIIKCLLHFPPFFLHFDQFQYILFYM